MYCTFSVLNEHGVYLDVHDGTSMGGSVVFEDRPSILNVLVDLMSETASLDALVRRLNGIWHSTSMILSIADETAGASMECSFLAGNRLRKPEGDSITVVEHVPQSRLGSRCQRNGEQFIATLCKHDGASR